MGFVQEEITLPAKRSERGYRDENDNIRINQNDTLNAVAMTTSGY